jgi:hypothetical protein
MSELACEWNLSNFSATAIYTGENRLIRVEGSGTCPQEGFSVELIEASPPLVPEPDTLRLQLVERRPEVGADVMTGVPVEASFDAAEEVRKVKILGLGELEVVEPG